MMIEELQDKLGNGNIFFINQQISIWIGWKWKVFGFIMDLKILMNIVENGRLKVCKLIIIIK
jgi:hypothetical protein